MLDENTKSKARKQILQELKEFLRDKSVAPLFPQEEEAVVDEESPEDIDVEVVDEDETDEDALLKKFLASLGE